MSISEPRPLDPQKPTVPDPGTDIIPAHLTKKGVAKKRGPKTAAGKAAISTNAIRHGLSSRRICVPGLEDPVECEAFINGILDSLNLVGALEEELGLIIAETMWRRNRVAPAEAEAIAVARERVAKDYARSASIVRPSTRDVAEARLAAAQEALAVCDFDFKSDATQIQLSKGTTREFYSAIVGRDPYMPDVTPVPESSTLADMLGMIGVLSGEQKIDSDELADLVSARLEQSVADRHRELRDLIEEQDRMTRERLLPAQAALQNITRHDAHLNRIIAQTSSQLETVQSRRNGLPTPLARVHFTTGA